MKRWRRWGLVGLMLALAAVAALRLAPRTSTPTTQAAQGADLIAQFADIAPDEFARMSGPWVLDLPADHSLHAGARTEIWQLSAHLEDEDGNPVGAQFHLFRIGLVGPDAPPPTSVWEPRELYRGHVVLVGPTRAASEERFGRGMVGLAGYDAALGELRLDSWAFEFPIQTDGDRWRLTTGPGDLGMELVLTPQKSPLHLDGDAAPFRGYAFSRLRAEGTVASEAGPRSVSGAAWFEHLWGDLPIPGSTPVASDRLQLQLDDGSELSIIRSRRIDGAGTPTFEALLIDEEGTVTAFDTDAMELEVLRRWQGGSGAWPVDWRLRLGDLHLDITPVTDAQEHAFMVSIWSGLVRAQGQRGGQPVSGLGTLQLTAERQ